MRRLWRSARHCPSKALNSRLKNCCVLHRHSYFKMTKPVRQPTTDFTLLRDWPSLQSRSIIQPMRYSLLPEQDLLPQAVANAKSKMSSITVGMKIEAQLITMCGIREHLPEKIDQQTTRTSMHMPSSVWAAPEISQSGASPWTVVA